jgi:hypothetical protein
MPRYDSPYDPSTMPEKLDPDIYVAIVSRATRISRSR